MNEDFAPIGDVISLVANQQPGEATVIVNDLLSARVLGALQSHKQDIAKSLFAPGDSALSEGQTKWDPKLAIDTKKDTLDSVMKHNLKAMKKNKSVKEETEQLDELSKKDSAGVQKERESLRKKGEDLRAAGVNYFLKKNKSVKEETEQLDEKNWIKGAIKHPGALHTALGVPQGEKIPAKKLEAASHKEGKVGQEARLAKTLKGLHEEIVQEEHESVEDFVKRGGKIKQVPAGKAHGSQKKQTIKVPFRMGKAAR